jgi:hypothetical protein
VCSAEQEWNEKQRQPSQTTAHETVYSSRGHS